MLSVSVRIFSLPLPCSVSHASSTMDDHFSFPAFLFLLRADTASIIFLRQCFCGIPYILSVWIVSLTFVQFPHVWVGTSPILVPHFVQDSMYWSSLHGILSVPLHSLFVQPLGSSLVHPDPSISCSFTERSPVVACSSFAISSKTREALRVVSIAVPSTRYNLTNSSTFHSEEVCFPLRMTSAMNSSFVRSSVMFSRLKAPIHRAAGIESVDSPDHSFYILSSNVLPKTHQ